MNSTTTHATLVWGLGLAMIFFSACGRNARPPETVKETKPPKVQLRTIHEEHLVQWLALTGTVVATMEVQISSTMEGPIAYCPWREGDAVKQGEKLIEINRPIYRREVDAAEAALGVAQAKLADLKAGARTEEIAQAAEMVTQLEENTRFAQSDLERIGQMVASGSLPGEAQDKARVAFVKSSTDLRAAKERLSMLQQGPTVTAVAVQDALVKETAARLARAEAVAAECVIVAPFAGIVTKVHVRPGDLATAKTPLLEMMAPSSLAVRFSLPERYAQQIRPGAAVRLSFDAFAGQEHESRVTMVYPELDTTTRTRLAEAAIPEEVQAAPGMFVRLEVAARELGAAMTVPESALLTRPDGQMVVYVVADGTARRRPVTIAMEADGMVALASGVAPGDQVVVRGHEMLKDGAKVQPEAPGGMKAAKQPAGASAPGAAGKAKGEPRHADN